MLGIEPSASASRTRRSTDDLHPEVLQARLVALRYNYSMTGSLYIVATPIGNLDDITFRAIKTLKEVDLIVSEDTRVTKKLLMHYGIDKDILSYHQQSNDYKKAEILKLLLEGRNIALVTDAGTPGISDPGNELISFVVDGSSEVRVVPIPGASSVTTALSVCGFDSSEFLFVGFWPKKKASKIVEKIKASNVPAVFFESPYRIMKTIDFLIEKFGEEREVFIGRELTKMYESLYRGTLKVVKEKLISDKTKGEFVVIINRSYEK